MVVIKDYCALVGAFRRKFYKIILSSIELF